MLDRDVLILELAGFLFGTRQDPAQPLRYVDLTGIGASAADPRNLL
jgi:hypothetical protein